MRYWTFQSKTVIDILNRDGVYYPDFSFSPQVHRKEYDQLLVIYNRLNQSAFKGVLFTIAKDGGEAFNDIQDLTSYLFGRAGVVQALNNGAYRLLDDTHLLVEIETGQFDDSQLCTVDLWNFIFMMNDDDDGRGEFAYNNQRYFHPELSNIGYEEYVDGLWGSLAEGVAVRSLFNSSITQKHLPFISKEMVKEIHAVPYLGQGEN